jgi:hypothetical protein
MKSTRAEVRKRVEEVFKLRLGGAEFADIREYARAPEQNWNVSDSQLWRYIAAADKLIGERFDARAEHLLNRHLLQRRTLYAVKVEAKDLDDAINRGLEKLAAAGQAAAPGAAAAAPGGAPSAGTAAR